MKLYEFILLILGVFSLIHYISYSLYRYRNIEYFIFGVYKENPNVYIIRVVEIILIIINIGIWFYKLLF